MKNEMGWDIFMITKTGNGMGNRITNKMNT